MVQINDPLFPKQWALEVMRAPEAWEIEMGNPDVIVGVIEFGFDLPHPDLDGQVLPGRDLWDGDDTLEDTSRPRGKDKDGTDHGTHMLGIIAARANNGEGVAGVAPGCRVLPIRTHCSDDERIATAIRYAVDNGARVVNMSNVGYMYQLKESFPKVIYGAWTPPTSDELPKACEYAFEHDVLLLSSPGGNQTHNVIKYPALGRGVLIVTSADRTGRMADFADYSPIVDVASPSGWRGGDDYARRASRILPIAEPHVIEQAVGEIGQPTYGVLNTIGAAKGGYAEWSGGCMAIAHVSGLAALVLSRNPSLSVDELKQVIRNTARQPVGDGQGHNPFVGHGTIDAAAALRIDRVESDLKITDVEITELDHGLGKAAITIANRGVLDAHGIPVMVFDSMPDAGDGVQLAHSVVSDLIGLEEQTVEVPFWIPEGNDSVVIACDYRGHASARQRSRGDFYGTKEARLRVAV